MGVRATTENQLERDEATGVERFVGLWRSHGTRRHIHPEYQLTLSVEGCGRFEYLGGRGRITAGCLAVFHPGEPHVIGNAMPTTPWRLRVLHVPARWLETDGSPLLQPAPFVPERGLVQTFDEVWQAVGRGGVARALRGLSRALRARPGLESTVHLRPDLVRRCLAALARIVDRPVRLDELAGLTRARPAQIRRAFAAAAGLPPLAWHLQRRVAEAKYRLARGDGIAETALATGFADQAHLTRHFTRHVGVTPARYVAGVRRRHRDD